MIGTDWFLVGLAVGLFVGYLGGMFFMAYFAQRGRFWEQDSE